MAMNFPATTDADKAYAMKAAEFRGLPNDARGMSVLQQATKGPFGSLALIEIDKRSRAELLDAVQKQNANQQDQTMLQQVLQRQAQAQMMNKLASDERMGLNNIVAQAESGALEFGQPMGGEVAIGASEGAMPMGAGGGVVAFKDGKEVKQTEGLFPWLYRKGIAEPFSVIPNINADMFETGIPKMLFGGKDMTKEEELALAEKITGGKRASVVPTTVSTPVDEYPDETTRGTARDVAKGKKAPDRFDSLGLEAKDEATAKAKGTGIAALLAPNVEKDPRKILAEESKLLAEMGLGEYGSKVKESMGKRRTEAEERADKRLGSETFLTAAEAAGGGGKRMSGLQALAAAVGGAGKSAMGIKRERDAAMDKITEGEERLALAQDLYERGRVSEAQKIGRTAEQQIFDNQIKLKTLDLTQRKIDVALAAAKAKASGLKIPQTVIAALEKERALIQDGLASKQITEQEAAQRLAAIQARINSYIMLGGGLQIGTRDTDED